MGKKPYFDKLDLKQARAKFMLESKMIKTVKMHFQSNPDFAKNLWKCWHCQNLDTIIHIKNCYSYRELRENKNLDDDADLVKYFEEVIQLREAD